MQMGLVQLSQNEISCRHTEPCMTEQLENQCRNVIGIFSTFFVASQSFFQCFRLRVIGTIVWN